MITKHRIQGYEDFQNFFKDLKITEPVYVLYTGTKLENGQSWCPDCVEAEPYIEKGFELGQEPCHLVTVEVGDRPFWKDPNCVFRTNTTTKLKVLPTLAKWGTQKRLEGDQCQKVDLIEMLLTDEDD